MSCEADPSAVNVANTCKNVSSNLQEFQESARKLHESDPSKTRTSCPSDGPGGSLAMDAIIHTKLESGEKDGSVEKDMAGVLDRTWIASSILGFVLLVVLVVEDGVKDFVYSTLFGS